MTKLKESGVFEAAGYEKISDVLAREKEKIAAMLSEEEKTDVFYAQQEMIGNLQELLDAQDQQVTYISPPAPIPKPRNYLIYIVLLIGILIYTGKIKLGKL